MRRAVDLRKRLYIAGQDWDFGWTPAELEIVRELREKRAKVWDVAQAVDRPDYEVAVLIMDLEERGVMECQTGS
jgi:hypothetical protein